MADQMPMFVPQEARSYEPTWRDQLAMTLMGLFGIDQNKPMSPDQQRMLQGMFGSSGLGQTRASLIDSAPGLGVAALGADMMENVAQSNPGGAMINAMQMALPMGVARGFGKAARFADMPGPPQDPAQQRMMLQQMMRHAPQWSPSGVPPAMSPGNANNIFRGPVPVK